MLSHQFHISKKSTQKGVKLSQVSSFDTWKDVEIWNAYKEGNEEAFIYIYSKYVNILFNFACHYTTNHELVKDCIQDLFILLKSKKTFGQVESIKPYLFKSLRREVVRALKKESRYALKDNDRDFQKFKVVLAWDEKIINDQFTSERKETIQKAIESLTEKQKEAIIYYYYEGFTYEEISQIMNMTSAKTARKLIYRAIDSLKLCIKDGDPGIFLMMLL